MDLTPDFDLTHLNTLGLPSRARLGAVISDPAQVAEIASDARARDLPLRIIGGGSNLLLHERIDAVIGIMATRGRQIERLPDGTARVTAQAGEDWSRFVAWTVAEGAPGLENLAGIPGTVGAAPVQNIGAYGVELADRMESLLAWDLHENRIRHFARAECAFSYRQSLFKRTANRYVVLEVTFVLPATWQPVLSYPGLDSLPQGIDAQTVHDKVVAIRSAKLPDWHKLGNAGSFFHNPVVSNGIAETIDGVPRYPQSDGTVKLSAAWLIEACGLKGYRQGPAGVYDRHALILVNHGGATYADIAAVAAKVVTSVRDKFGVTLVQEPLEP